jgi:1-acyl-sn-glycerol-3-phosphate acyltransferase
VLGALYPRAATGVGAAFARVRALLFYLVTVILSLPLFVSMVLITPFQLAFDKYRRAALHFVNDIWATCSTSLFYGVEVS